MVRNEDIERDYEARIAELGQRLSQQQSDRMALVEQAALLQRERDEARRNPVPVVALSLHEARIKELTAEIARLLSELAKAQLICSERADVTRLTEEREEARAEVERLLPLENHLTAAKQDIASLRGKLTAANALLERCRKSYQPMSLMVDICAYLDGRTCLSSQPAAPDPRDAAGVALLKEALAAAEQEQKRLVQQSVHNFERAEAAEQKLAAAEQARIEERGRWEQKLNAAEQKLAQLRAMNATQREDLHSVSVRLAAAESGVKHSLHRGRQTLRRAEAAEQKLAAAEREMRSSHRVVIMRERDAAEARVRELEDMLHDADNANLTALRAAESELAQLRERVAKATIWLVTVKADLPASIIADRARLALEASMIADRARLALEALRGGK